MRRLVQRAGFAFGDPVDADGQMRDVAGDVGRAEDFGLAAERAPAQAVHLPKPILGHGDAETKIHIGRARGIDVRDAGTIAQYLDAAGDRAGELLCFLHDVPTPLRSPHRLHRTRCYLERNAHLVRPRPGVLVLPEILLGVRRHPPRSRV